jgi:hypothetical protein
MVQKRPAKESAIKAPINGVRLAVPLKLVRVLEAFTSGRLSSCVRYVIMLAWKPVAANLSHISFPVKHICIRVNYVLVQSFYSNYRRNQNDSFVRL